MSERAMSAPLFRDEELSAALSSNALLANLLQEQRRLDTAVTRFSEWHGSDASPSMARHYRHLIPTAQPQSGEQYAFEVNLDECTGCKACVTACHSLNGLDENESWRSVGAIISPSGIGYQQTITSACHHCEDPACANGCPVLAYEKDAITGIVKHLDDQCIGCSYCILKCPYDVPKLNVRLGIVRKCDMCSARLAEGEAPACVQACPSGAISIGIHRRSTEADVTPLLPGLVRGDYTRPTTTYISSRSRPTEAHSSEAMVLRVEPTHWPLVLMLLLTQISTGLFLATLFTPDSRLLWIANGALNTGLIASVLHLGQPLRAWRCFLGWRKSWLSREIVVFGMFAAAGGAALLSAIPAWLAAGAGALGVFCSIMVYVDTQRPDWRVSRTTLAFGGTCAVAFSSALSIYNTTLVWIPALVIMIKAVGISSPWFRDRQGYTSLMHFKALPGWSFGYLIASALAIPLLWINPFSATVAALTGEVLERALFFKTVRAWRMPIV